MLIYIWKQVYSNILTLQGASSLIISQPADNRMITFYNSRSCVLFESLCALLNVVSRFDFMMALLYLFN